MRSLAFNLFFYSYTVVFALFLIPFAVLPGRGMMAWGLRRWGRTVVWAMRAIGGMTVEVRGRENIPAAGPSLIASKHQSEADGMVMAAEIPDVAFVAMRELWAYPLVGTILRKLEMIRVDTCGGGRERENLATFARRAFEANKATKEIHHTVDPTPTHDLLDKKDVVINNAGAAIVQIILLDLVFSVDSILTAVGMTDHIPIMMAAVIVAVTVMLLAATPLADFIDKNPTVVMLALGFLLMIGMVLIADGFGDRKSVV